MSEHVTRHSLRDQVKGRTDHNRLDRLTDADIEAAITQDPDAAPLLDSDWFNDAELVLPEPKQAVSMRIDADVLRWYKAQGPGYLSRMNAVLRQYAEAKGARLASRSARSRRIANREE
jgi:uncharacterized protein (DUF4415 family)